MVIIKKCIQKYSNTSIKGFRLAGDPIPRFFLHTRGRERERESARTRERERETGEGEEEETNLRRCIHSSTTSGNTLFQTLA